MSVRHQEIIFGLAGQSFHYDPPEGKPSGTPTVQVFSTGADDEATPESATTGACSVDAVSTTLASSASAGDRTITLDDASAVVAARRYLVTASTGEQEWVDVRGKSGASVTLRRPLVNSYALGSTVVGCRISIAVDTTWASSRSKLTDVLGAAWRTTVATPSEWAPGAAGYRLRWSYTVGGVVTIGVGYADLVRYQSKNLVTPADVDRRFPGWIDRLGPDDRRDQGAGLIEEAFAAVKMDALADAQVVRRLRDTQVLGELVKYRANVLAAESNVLAGAPTEQLREAERLYERRYDQLLREPKIAADQTGGGASGEARRLPVSRR